MNKQLKIAVIGAGARGRIAYGQYCLEHPEDIKVIATVEPNQQKLAKMQAEHKISDKYCFTNEDDFYALGKICDAVIIANQDKDHYYSTMQCLELGYDILLEKPITPSKAQLLEIDQKAKEKSAKIMVCHVLRYSPFFAKVKELTAQKVIGEVIGIDHTEYIGNYHMAHSFVRGNWRNDQETSPIVLQKTCHDLDILTWLSEANFTQVNSHGKLNYFNNKNKPQGATKKCIDCPHQTTCIYDAQKVYIDPLPGGWSKNVTADLRPEKVKEFISQNNYGTCVYQVADNNVCDHQISTILFENDINVTFTMTAFHQEQVRFTRIFGTKGSMVCDQLMNTIQIQPYIAVRDGEQQIQVIKPKEADGAHGGGDNLLMEDFVNYLRNPDHKPRTDLAQSIQSHLLAYELEEKRLANLNKSQQKMESYEK